MKYVTIAWFVSLACLVTAPVFADVSLVAVDLPTKADVARWHQLDVPTVELIGTTAFAWLDARTLSDIEEAGFAPVRIDRGLKDGEEYVVVFSSGGQAGQVSGETVWRGGDVLLLACPRSDYMAMKRHGVAAKPLNARSLSERFWGRATASYVPLASLPYDPFIQSLVDQVSADTMGSFIQRLQDFHTRLILTDSSYAASQWIRDRYAGWGYPVAFDSIYIDSAHTPSWRSGYERNVIASVTGSYHANREYIISGHFDSQTFDFLNPYINKPGADDNATGTATAMEAARVFQGHQWESSIKFVAWAAEEGYGLGALHYAAFSDSIGRDIGGMLNFDMTGWMNDSVVDCYATGVLDHSQWLAGLFYSAGQRYVPGLVFRPPVLQYYSDDYPFNSYGYPAISAFEYDQNDPHTNPYIHTQQDLATHLAPAQYGSIAKAGIAALAILARYPDRVSNVTVRDIGDGTRLAISWSPNIEGDVIGYRIYYGLPSGVYTDSVFTAATADTLEGLLPDSVYYIAVRALDDAGGISYLAEELPETPSASPAEPALLRAEPYPSAISLSWQPNTELDLQGYRAYRSTDGGTYDSLNTALLSDTFYLDTPLSGAPRYYYKVRAFDLNGNAGPFSDSAYGRPATLDQGLLVVDETQNWTSGSWPRDTIHDQF